MCDDDAVAVVGHLHRGNCRSAVMTKMAVMISYILEVVELLAVEMIDAVAAEESMLIQVGGWIWEYDLPVQQGVMPLKLLLLLSMLHENDIALASDG